MGRRADVVVVGNGPAGLAAAAACAEDGLDVTVLAEEHDRRWPQTLAAWADEVEGLVGPDSLADRWPDVCVHLGERRPRRLQRAYARFDNDHLQDALSARAHRAGARRATGRAVGAEHDAEGSVVVTDAGALLACRVAVDASGHTPALLARPRGRPPAVQTAFGIVGRFSHVPFPSETVLLMDYRDPPGADDTGPPDPMPTFLYGMALDDGCHLLEETSLAARPGLAFDVLEARLHRRLKALGVRVEQRVGVERVRIPMGGPLPARDQRVVGFGAAAGMVHPATGYQVGAALSRASCLAAALTRAIDRPRATPAALAGAGWDAVWPSDLVRQRALHALGLESLLRLEPEATRSFFRAFFDLPDRRWGAFLSGERSAAALAATMLALFARVPSGVRARLAGTAVRNPGLLREALLA